LRRQLSLVETPDPVPEIRAKLVDRLAGLRYTSEVSDRFVAGK
jgi:hypothetical protein